MSNQEALTVLAQVQEGFLTKSKAHFGAFIQDGNDADRLQGNKWGACAKDLGNTIKRLEASINN